MGCLRNPRMSKSERYLLLIPHIVTVVIQMLIFSKQRVALVYCHFSQSFNITLPDIVRKTVWIVGVVFRASEELSYPAFDANMLCVPSFVIYNCAVILKPFVPKDKALHSCTGRGNILF